MPEMNRMNTDGSVNVMEYRRALGAFMTGVTVVTTKDSEGRSRGMTMNSFASVSLDPPLVLVCVDYRTASYQAFVESDGIAVHILGADQQELARTFASKSPDKFEDLDVGIGKGGAPLITDVHAWLDCVTDRVVVAGDHAIIIGRVMDYDASDRRPLAFYQGKFNSFSADEEIVQQQSEAQERTAIRWVVENVDEQLALVANKTGLLSFPHSSLAPEQLSHSGLSEAATEELGCSVEIDFLYSIYDGDRGRPVLVYRGRITDSEASPSSEFVLFDPSQFDDKRFPDDSEAAVMARYINERIGSEFGIYVGSQTAGAVASLINEAPRPSKRAGV